MIENNNMVYTEEKAAEATNEILINEAEFDAAVLKAATEVSQDSKREAESAFVIVMTGTSFASHMKKFLFGKEEEK